MDRHHPMDPDEHCNARTRQGTPCQNEAGKGTQHLGEGRCSRHGGASPQAELAGVVQLAKREAAVMGRPIDVDPHDAIIECIRIAAGEVQYASEQIWALDESEATGRVTTDIDRRAWGGEQAVSYEQTTHGPPALNIWIAIRHQAMDRLVKYSEVALRAGVEQQLVDAATKYASEIAQMARQLAISLGHDPADPKVREAMRGSLTVVSGGRA